MYWGIFFSFFWSFLSISVPSFGLSTRDRLSLESIVPARLLSLAVSAARDTETAC